MLRSEMIEAIKRERGFGPEDFGFDSWEDMQQWDLCEAVRGLGTLMKYTRSINANQHTITHPDGTEHVCFGYHGHNAWFDIVEPGWSEKRPYPNRPRMEAKCKGMMEWVV